MKKILSYIIFATLGILFILTLFYDSGSNFAPCQAWGSFMLGGQSYGMHYAGSSGFLGFRDFGLAFWILVALLVYILISNSRDDEEAIEILNKRFARGEISREEYMMLKREIMAKDSKTE
ncbi:hypothetical protein BMS3Bbin15_00022 [archaeon BMS3Bbin15]|nr:hypothetical protein BMS3Bbin15_00022 [archaeon BMS3Bbin15]